MMAWKQASNFADSDSVLTGSAISADHFGSVAVSTGSVVVDTCPSGSS